MRIGWSSDVLARRIDRCYLIAAWTRVAEKRDHYLAMARHYRAVLARLSGPEWQGLVARA
jgi:hypothetical protein